MQHITNCFDVLLYLRAYGSLSPATLAEWLDVPVRKVYEYKKALTEVGYWIETNNGHYEWHGRARIPLRPWTTDEREQLAIMTARR